MPKFDCIDKRCYSPIACGGFGYCRERNHDGNQMTEEKIKTLRRQEECRENEPCFEEVAALVVLSECNIPHDIQELLVYGDPSRGIPPRTLRKAIEFSKKQRTLAIPRSQSNTIENKGDGQ